MATQWGSYITFFTLVGDNFTSVGDISRRQANTREVSDIFHFTAIHYGTSYGHSAMVLVMDPRPDHIRVVKTFRLF